MTQQQETYITTFSNDDDDWYTPSWLVDRVHDLFGVIDLDPASSEQANKVIQANKIYTKADNGLAHTPWQGKVFLNPPSKAGDKLAKPHLWAETLRKQYVFGMVDEAILVVKSVLGYKWYEQLYHDYWVCHLTDRPQFVKPDGSLVGKAKKGVSVFYFGVNHYGFCRHFCDVGRIIPCVADLEQALRYIL